MHVLRITEVCKKGEALEILKNYMFNKPHEFATRQIGRLLLFRTKLICLASAAPLVLACTISAIKFYYKWISFSWLYIFYTWTALTAKRPCPRWNIISSILNACTLHHTWTSSLKNCNLPSRNKSLESLLKQYKFSYSKSIDKNSSNNCSSLWFSFIKRCLDH